MRPISFGSERTGTCLASPARRLTRTCTVEQNEPRQVTEASDASERYRYSAISFCRAELPGQSCS
jgi:hypothetical protein